jgi:hypothetical protein
MLAYKNKFKILDLKNYFRTIMNYLLIIKIKIKLLKEQTKYFKKC